jgi:mannose-1-phosphate guanylyltransferase
VVVVTGVDHGRAVAEQLPNIPAENILEEPVGRNTAAAAGLGALWVAERDPKGVCLVLPADHLIADQDSFLNTLQQAAEAADQRDCLVTLGLKPRHPATGFGYIELADTVQPGPPDICRVAAFHEKPDLDTAREYLGTGRHLWNSGMFAWRADVLLAEMDRWLPPLTEGLRTLGKYLGGAEQDRAMERIYPRLPSISVDYGVLEKSDRLLVVNSDFQWSDVGSWEAMAELWPCDDAGNACRTPERVLALDASGNLVEAGDRLVALLGVQDLVVVASDDVLLIMPRSRGQELKEVLALLEERGFDHHL